MIAMEMKMAGVYVSRHLPLSNVIVDLEQVIPSDNFACAYGRATELVICFYHSINIYKRKK